MSTEIEAAKETLQAAGYVVIREKSYRAAQERQRIAEALRADAVERREATWKWAHAQCLEQNRLRDRLTFVYGVARARGATVAELSGPPVVAAVSGTTPTESDDHE